MVNKKRGRPKTAPAIEPIAPAAWDRIKRMVARGALEAIHGSEIGRLSYHSELNATETSAAFRIGEIYGRFERTVGRRRSARSPSYEMGFAGQASEAQRLTNKTEEDEAREAKDAWDGLQTKLASYPAHARACLERLCVEDRAVEFTDIHDVRLILGWLGQWFGIVSAGKKRLATKTAKVVLASGDIRISQRTKPTALDQHCFGLVLGKYAPHLSQDQLDSAFGVFSALKSREVHRREKERRR